MDVIISKQAKVNPYVSANSETESSVWASLYETGNSRHYKEKQKQKQQEK